MCELSFLEWFSKIVLKNEKGRLENCLPFLNTLCFDLDEIMDYIQPSSIESESLAG